jgi:hypothetical protein
MEGRVESQRCGLPRFSKMSFCDGEHSGQSGFRLPFPPFCLGWGAMDNLINLEFVSEQVDAVLKAWAIFIPSVVLLLWVAWKIRGIFKA